MRITVLASPWPADENLPWQYDQVGFLNWYDEVFREGGKRENPPVGVMDAIEDLRSQGYKIEWDDSMYRGSHPFQRKQLVFAVEAILVSALDRVESGMPTSGITWQDRLDYANKIDSDPKTLSAYDRGALECAGMFLGVLYAQLTGDGLGIYDALHCADRFDEAVREWVEKTWADEGKAVEARITQRGQGGWQVGDVYDNYPDCRKHAEAFVNEVFAEYIAEAESPLSEVGLELDDGGAICFPDNNGDIRRIDSNGNTEEVRGIGDPDWKEWRDLFPDDALYFQPEGAGDPDCGTSAASINSFDVYRIRENAEQAHSDCEILGFTFTDIEKPVFLDVEKPTFHNKNKRPRIRRGVTPAWTPRREPFSPWRFRFTTLEEGKPVDDVIWVPNNIVICTLAEALEGVVNSPLCRVDDAPGCGCYLEGANIDGEYEDGLDTETAPVLRIQVSGIELDDREAYSEQDEANIHMLWNALLDHRIPETDTRLGKMKERIVRVRFDGDVKVLVPEHVSDADADVLAEKMALSRIVATTDNSNGPEEVACDEYLDEASGNASEKDWDESSCATIGGSWTIEPVNSQ